MKPTYLIAVLAGLAVGGPAARADISDIFYVSAGVGVENVRLETMQSSAGDLTAQLIPSSLSGPAPQLAVGVRLAFFQAGLRASVAFFDEDSAMQSAEGMRLWNLNAEVAVRTGFGAAEPYLMVSGGYSRFGGLGDAISGLKEGLDIQGGNVQLAGGMDVDLTAGFSLGLRIAGGFLFLQRDGIAEEVLAEAEREGKIGRDAAMMLEAKGDSVGAIFGITALGTYRF